MITDHLTVTVALLALGVLATAEVFADNSSATLTPMLVHRDDLAIANSRIGAGFITLNQLAGPPIGAALFAAGMAWPFVAQAVLVIAGVLLVSRVALPVARLVPQTEISRGVLRDIAEGFRWTVHHAAVRTLSLTILIFNITFGAAWSVLVLYAQQRLGLGAIGFGLIATVSAVGGLLGTGLYGWITRRVSLGNVMRVGLIIETLTHLALAVTTSPWVASSGLLRLRRARVRLGHDDHHGQATGRSRAAAGPGRQCEYRLRVRRPGRRFGRRRLTGLPIRRHGTVLVRLRRLGGLRGTALARTDANRSLRRSDPTKPEVSTQGAVS